MTPSAQTLASCRLDSGLQAIATPAWIRYDDGPIVRPAALALNLDQHHPPDSDSPAFGLLTYPSLRGRFNVGDYIQSIAARRFLPRVEHYVEREALDAAPVAAGTRIILNGWFMHAPRNWPPTPRIDPLITSFHINRSAEVLMMRDSALRYLADHGPVGCRDLNTLKLLHRHGVEAYFSACLTLTLRRDEFRQRSRTREGVFLVDPIPGLARHAQLFASPIDFARAIRHSRFGEPTRLRAILARILAPDLRRNAHWLEHEVAAGNHSHAERFELARRRLTQYANAELVITSRIHCALPCLAFGTPVIFVNSSAADEVSTCRFDGLIDLLNVIDVEPDRLEASAGFDMSLPLDRTSAVDNTDRYLKYRSTLEHICSTFISTGRRVGA